MPSWFNKISISSGRIFSKERRLKLASWSILPISISVAVVCAIAINTLNQSARNSSNSRLLFTRLKEQLSRLNSLQWEAINKGRIDENLTEELAENSDSSQNLVVELKLDTAHRLERQKILSLFKQYQKKVNKTLDLISVGKTEKILAVDVEGIDEIYDDLGSEILNLEEIYIQQQQNAKNLAEFGIYSSLAFSALIIGLLSRKFSQDLRYKNSQLETAIANLKQAQTQLIQQEKMAALGQVSAGISHEINNPLGAIKASANNTHSALQSAFFELRHLQNNLSLDKQEVFFQLIDRSLNGNQIPISAERRTVKRKLTAYLQQNDVPGARYAADKLIDMGISEEVDSLLPLLKTDDRGWALQLAHNLACSYTNNCIIINEVDRSSKIVFALKNYARFDPNQKRQYLNISDGIEAVFSIYQNQLKRNINIVRDYQDIPEVHGYPDELIQVWTNLVYNAIQALPSGGTITVKTRHLGDGVEIAIKDTGTGIPLEIQNKIFDAFFTTKSVGEGSGLGLHICQQIIDKHHGKISVESKPGQTQFVVWLPIESNG